MTTKNPNKLTEAQARVRELGRKAMQIETIPIEKIQEGAHYRHQSRITTERRTMSTYDRTYDYGRKPKSLDEVRIGGHVAAYVGQIGEPPHEDFQEEREVHGEVLAINRDTGKIYARPTGTSPDRVIALELADIFWSQYSVAQQASDAQLRRYLEENWDPVIGDWRNKLSDEEREAEIKETCDWDPVIGAWVRKDLSELECESLDTIRNAWRGDVPLIDWIANENGPKR